MFQYVDGIEFNAKKVNVSDHAFRRIAERIGIKDKQQALGDTRSNLKYAKCLGIHSDEEGNPAYLLAYGRTAYYLNLELTNVKRFT